MKRNSSHRRRPAVQISLGRAARLYRLVILLAQNPQTREDILRELEMGLRTFYRELELLKRCGVKVLYRQKTYNLQLTAEQAQGRLPFPDPQLSFAEMAELARHPGEAAKRLAGLLESVLHQPAASPKVKGRRRGRPSSKPKEQENV
ncbi:MAG: hypothetical protein NVSMB9_28320 [Isosphaeraceae bacterium]